MLLILLLDLVIPRMPFRFLRSFGFERGPVSSHNPDVASYRVQADWTTIVKTARTELEADGFHEVPGDERITFQRGTGEAKISVHISRDAKTAEIPRRHLPFEAPGWTAIFIEGIDQRPLVVRLLDLLP